MKLLSTAKGSGPHRSRIGYSVESRMAAGQASNLFVPSLNCSGWRRDCWHTEHVPNKDILSPPATHVHKTIVRPEPARVLNGQGPSDSLSLSLSRTWLDQHRKGQQHTHTVCCCCVLLGTTKKKNSILSADWSFISIGRVLLCPSSLIFKFPAYFVLESIRVTFSLSQLREKHRFSPFF